MPNYTREPPKESAGVSLPIFRTPASGKIRAIVTSEDLVGTNTHFWGGHTVPCGGAVCDACRNGIPFRWHAYLTAYVPQKGLHFLYECTATAAEVLVAWRRKHGRLRGCVFEAYRWRSARNGRVMLRCEPHPDDVVQLPAPPVLENVLAILWQLPKDNVKPTDERYLGREIDVNIDVPGVNLPLDRKARTNA